MKVKRRLSGHWMFAITGAFLAPPGIASGIELGGPFGHVITAWAVTVAVVTLVIVIHATDNIPIFTETPTYAQLARDVDRLEAKVEKSEALNQRLTNALVEAPRAVGECARDREK